LPPTDVAWKRVAAARQRFSDVEQPTDSATPRFDAVVPPIAIVRKPFAVEAPRSDAGW
jgi:hypothetical protein